MADDIKKERIGDSEARTQAQIDLEKKILELQQEQASTAREKMRLQKQQQDNELEAYEAEIRRVQDLALLSQEILSNKEQRLQLSEEELKFHERRVNKSAEDLAIAKERLKTEKEAQAVRDGMESFTDNLIERLTGIGAPTTGAGRMLTNPKEFFGALGRSGMKAMIPLNIVGSTIDKIQEMTLQLAIEQDAASVAFNNATGASGEFDEQIRSTNMNMRFAGVDAMEAGQAYSDLYNVVSDFTLLSEREQTVLAETTAILKELGVSSQATAKNIQLATKGLGMSVTQAEYLVRDLNTFARDLGVSTAQIAEDFSNMSPMITELGTQGVQAFKNLQREAKATGIDMNRLYNITSNFDTFDQAAQSVGKLNAMLGGPFLNTMDMVMEEDPAERMTMLKEAVDQAGLSFDTMSKFQRKALAEAMGLNDATELAMILRGREDLLPGADKSAEDLEAMMSRQKEFNSVAEEFKQIMMGFAVSLGPFVSMLKGFMDAIQPFVPTIIAIGGAIATIMSPLGWLAGTIAALTASMPLFSQIWYIGASPPVRKMFEDWGASTESVAASHDHLNKKVRETGRELTVAGTGMPAAAATVASNQQAAQAMPSKMVFEINGRTFAELNQQATRNAISTELVRTG